MAYIGRTGDNFILQEIVFSGGAHLEYSAFLNPLPLDVFSEEKGFHSWKTSRDLGVDYNFFVTKMSTLLI